MKIDDIIANAPMGISKDLMMRHLYIELGKIHKRDVKFFYGTDEQKMEIYNREIDLNNEEILEIICKSIGKSYVEAFRRVGITARCFQKETKSPFPHVDIIATPDGEHYYYMNPMDDLYRIQCGMQTKRYGSKTQKYDGLSFYTEEQLKEMDDKLGYTYQGMYTDEFFEMLRREFLDRSKLKEHILNENPELTNRDLTKDFLLEYKLDFIFKYINAGKDLQGYIELRNYYKEILGDLLNKTENKKIRKHNMYKIDKNGKGTLQTAIELALEGRNVYYLTTNGQIGYQKMTPQELIEYMENGEWHFLKEKRNMEQPEERE